MVLPRQNVYRVIVFVLQQQCVLARRQEVLDKAGGICRLLHNGSVFLGAIATAKQKNKKAARGRLKDRGQERRRGSTRKAGPPPRLVTSRQERGRKLVVRLVANTCRMIESRI